MKTDPIKIKNLTLPMRMKVVQGPLKPLEVGQYHHRQPKFMQIQYVQIVCAETWQLKYLFIRMCRKMELSYSWSVQRTENP